MYFLLVVVSLIVTTSAADSVERLISEMVRHVLNVVLSCTH